MSGEPEARRSARATKGQHKALEQLDQPVEAPKKRGKKTKKEEEEPADILRCVCGKGDDDLGWIACDNCLAWQHGVCMDVDIDNPPDKYFCEQCRPQDHKKLLAAMARGEQPWIGRREAEEEKLRLEEEQDRKSKKKGKKGKGKRVSDPEAKQSPAPEPKTSAKSTPAPEHKKAKPSPAPTTDSKKAKASPAPSTDHTHKRAKQTAVPLPTPVPLSETSKKARKAADAPPPSSTAPTPAAPPAAAGKRKNRDESHDQDGNAKPTQKMRKVSESQGVAVSPPVSAKPPTPTSAAPELPPAVLPVYNPPADIPAKIGELSDDRKGPAKALFKALTNSIGAAEKKGTFVPSKDMTAAAKAEQLALQIERAVRDSHPDAAYLTQVKTLNFNLKSNQELTSRLLQGTLTPLMLAAMTTEELASKELQKETAEMKARAEKQSILINEDGPRMRRTHKGEEIVGDESTLLTEETPAPHVRRRSTIVREQTSESAAPAPTGDPDHAMDDEPQVELPAQIESAAASSGRALHIDTQKKQQQNNQRQPQHSPKTDFDINKVFSSVKSPTTTNKRRPSALPVNNGPGVDHEVDRMLRDDGTESPPYSPTEENDPDVLWRGSLVMNTVADLPVKAKYIAGVKLNETVGIPWTTLIPSRLSVAGRIDMMKATEYLCGMRYNNPTDLIVVSLEPAVPAARSAFLSIFEYFVSKKRFGVVGEKGVGQVRDTYLVPVQPGTAHPEFMGNFLEGTSFLPDTITEPTMLCVFVYRNEPSTVRRQQESMASAQSVESPLQGHGQGQQSQGHGAVLGRNTSVSAPQFSPTNQQGSFTPGPPPTAWTPSHTPLQAPQLQAPPGPSPPQSYAQSQAPYPPPPALPSHHSPHPVSQVPHNPQVPQNGAKPQVNNTHLNKPPVDPVQAEGERTARQILGPLMDSPTVQFLLPHASRMQPKEWELVRDVYIREPAARTDLNQLSAMLAKESSTRNAERESEQPSSAQSQPQQPQQLQHPQHPQQTQQTQQAQQQPQPSPQLLRAHSIQQTPQPPSIMPSQGVNQIVPPPIPPKQTPVPIPQIPTARAGPPPAPTA